MRVQARDEITQRTQRVIVVVHRVFAAQGALGSRRIAIQARLGEQIRAGVAPHLEPAGAQTRRDGGDARPNVVVAAPHHQTTRTQLLDLRTAGGIGVPHYFAEFAQGGGVFV
jgi:hypothetical protein